MKTLMSAFLLVLLAHAPAFATWSVIAVDARTGQVIIASATCVRQSGFPSRKPNAARDLMDVQAVIVPGVGVADLVEIIAARAEAAVGDVDTLIPARARHVALLQKASAHLVDSLAEGSALELRAEALRLAGEAFGRIAGTLDVEEVLGVIFSEFCIGK